jgi:hypothetical protein
MPQRPPGEAMAAWEGRLNRRKQREQRERMEKPSECEHRAVGSLLYLCWDEKRNKRRLNFSWLRHELANQVPRGGRQQVCYERYPAPRPFGCDCFLVEMARRARFFPCSYQTTNQKETRGETQSCKASGAINDSTY